MSDVIALFEPDADRIIRALEADRGNVTSAATRLGVESAWLRREIMKTPALEAAMAEIRERDVDRAEGIIRAGMEEESYLVRFYAAKEFLRTEAGRKRGFGPPANQAQVVEGGGGRAAVIVLKWIGDDEPEPKQIENDPLK